MRRHTDVEQAAGGSWECQRCRSHQVNERLLLSSEHLEIHRLSCASCKTVGHFDRDVVSGGERLETVRQRFVRIAAHEEPTTKKEATHGRAGSGT